MVNITQIGVDKPSGSPLITRSNKFIFNGDLEGSSDFLYYLGTQLSSSYWRNPNSTQFLEANLIQGGGSVVPGGASTVVDNNKNTTFLNNSTSSNEGVELKFNNNFRVDSILINGTPAGWQLQASSDNGNNFVNLTLQNQINLGDSWYQYTITSAGIDKNIYRFIHGQEGVSKTLNNIKLYGEYITGTFSPSKEDNTLILNCRDSEGKIYLPDATVENYPDDYYFECLNLYENSYSIESIAGSTTNIVNNTTKPLTKGEKYIFVYNSNQWNVFKVGATPNLGSKGALLSQDGVGPTVVPPGVSGQTLVRDDSALSGLNWVNLSLNNQLFNPIITSSFTLDDSFNNKMIPVDTGGGNIIITLGVNVQPGFQVIIYHYGGGEVIINPNSQVYRARGNKILNSNAAITLSFDSATSTWYGIGDLVQE